jgi:predicted Zn finger-like uncharacterized protein
MASGLATRCPACGTVFRVVADQLRVSDGWVRCGRCSDVFNAAEALMDLETGAPRRMPAEPPVAAAPSVAVAGAAMLPTAPPSTVAAPAAPAWSASAVDPGWSSRADAADGPTAAPPQPMADADDPTPSVPDTVAEFGRDDGAPPSEPPVVDTMASRFADDAADADLAAPGAAPAAAAEAAGEALPMPTPSFLRRAQRAERWRSPRLRAALAAMGVLALLGLLAQAAWAWRDLIAVQAPALRPALAAACDALGCRLAPPRAIEGLVVDSSGLVRVERSNLYRLSVTLRNRAAHEVALPALELALTDAQGRLIARRVLQPAEFGVQQTLLPAGRDLALQGTLQIADTVAGYTVELFYP